MSSDQTANKIPKEEAAKIKTRLLSNRGIGRKYHYMSLNRYENSEEFVELVKEYSKEDRVRGNGISIVGDSATAYDIAVLVARALLLLESLPDLRVVQFSELVDLNTGVLAELSQTGFPTLLILDYHPDSAHTSPSDYRRVESILKRHYVNESKPLLLHFPVPHIDNKNAFNYGDLASKNFIEHITNKNYTVVID